jgi:hypothetical protein
VFILIPAFMKYILRTPVLVLLLSVLYSCSTKLDVNAPWKDITVIYGLLNQNDSIHYIKITKAFLGEGDAMMFAQNADSSNYPDKLHVEVQEWRYLSSTDSVLHNTYVLDTTSITNKDPGIFYYPTQLVYYFKAKLDTLYTYNLSITRISTGKVVTAQTKLIQRMNIKIPIQGSNANIRPGFQVPISFYGSPYGRRYQLTLRFFYDEYHKVPQTDTLHNLTVEWTVFNNIVSTHTDGTDKIDPFIYGDGLYSTLNQKLSKIYTKDTTRHATYVDYILTVGSDDLNTYMNATAPSNTIVQERPSFTNIVNGIGIFTSRYDNTIDNPRHLHVGQVMQDSLKAYSDRNFLGF